MQKLTLEFGGFYETQHGANIEEWPLRCYTNDHGDIDPNAPDVNYPLAMAAYGRDYVQWLNKRLAVALVFDRIDSPREYNFETDRIIVDASLDDLAKVWEVLGAYGHMDDIMAYIQDKTTASSGYRPNFSMGDVLADVGLKAWFALSYWLTTEEATSEWESWADTQCLYDHYDAYAQHAPNTVGALIERLQEMDYKTPVAAILWHAEDVHGIDSSADVEAVFANLIDNHDANIGINWDSIEAAIEAVKE